MVLSGHSRVWEDEREVVPDRTAMPPPPYLVYKRRLYVLARKAPVLDHHQTEIDSVFGAVDEPRTRPAPPARPGARTAVHPQAANKARSGAGPVQTDKPRRIYRPRFVARHI